MALGNLNGAKAVEQLIMALKDENSNFRFSVIRALGELNDTRAVEPLIQDEDSDVRENAAKALDKLNDSREVEPLESALNDEDEDPGQEKLYNCKPFILDISARWRRVASSKIFNVMPS